MSGVDPFAGIFHINAYFGPPGIHFTSQRNATLRSKLVRIAEEVGNDLYQAELIHCHIHSPAIVHLQPELYRRMDDHLMGTINFRNNLRQVIPFYDKFLIIGVQSRNIQHITDQLEQQLAVMIHNSDHILLLLLVKLPGRLVYQDVGEADDGI